MEGLRTKVVAGWPKDEEEVPLDVTSLLDMTRLGVRMRGLEYTSQPGVRQRIWVLYTAGTGSRHITVSVMGGEESRMPSLFVGDFFVLSDHELRKEQWIKRATVHAMAFVDTRGSGQTAWDPSRDTHIRRRFALIGQTLDGMRAYDLRRAIAVLKGLPELSLSEFNLVSSSNDAAICLVAALREPAIHSVTLNNLAPEDRANPTFLNLDRVVGWPQAVGLMMPRLVAITTDRRDAWRWSTELGQSLGMPNPWPDLQER
jgi:hypothetical protein